MGKGCIVEGCGKVASARGYCNKHYFRLRRQGNLEKPKNKRGILMEEKKSYCYICGEVKDLSEFHKDRHSFYGISKSCKYCAKGSSKASYIKNKARHKDYTLRKKFGITLEEYNTMLNRQDSKCCICGNLNTDNKYMPVDHCHKTGVVRGILCDRCNMGLGFFDDNVDNLKNAIMYLNKERISKI